MHKKITTCAFVVGLCLFSPSFASAVDEVEVYTPPSAKPMVTISAAGNITVRGKLESKTASMITLSSWGTKWTVAVPETSNVSPIVTGANMADRFSKFETGDLVGISGTITTSGVITSKYVRDWTIRRAPVTVRKTMEGTMSNVVAGTGFDMTVGELLYHVSMTPITTKVIDKNYAVSTPGIWKDGDKARVYGSVRLDHVDAEIIRDMSVPRPIAL